MTRLTRKTALALTLSLGAIAVSLAFFGLLWYSLGEYEGRLRAASAELAYRDAAREHAHSLEQLAAETAADRAELARFVLAEEDVAAFLSETERIGRALGLAVRTVSVEKRAVEGDANFEQLALQFEMVGPLDQVERMVGLFGSFPYRIVVERVALDRMMGEGPEAWRATAHLIVSAYKTH